MGDIQHKKKGNPNWHKGVSGNPGGRHKDATGVGEMVRQILAEHVGKDTWGYMILRKAAELAADGSSPHMTFLFDRGYGKPTETMTLQGGLSLYEQGASEAAKLSDEASRLALLASIRKLTSGRTEK